MLQYWGYVCPATASSLMRAAADPYHFSTVVDVYNGATGAWTTAQLSVARPMLAAASVGNVALFAGGGSDAVDIYCNSTSAAACQAHATTAALSTTATATTTAAPPPPTTIPTTNTAASTTATATTALSPPPSTTSPSPPPLPTCTHDCGSCCCPGCHAINGTCYACAAGSFSSDCSNHTQSSCSICPFGFYCPEGAIQPYVPAFTLAAIIACVVLADLVLACVFLCSKRLNVADAKGWILAALLFGPFVWIIWWYKHRDVGPSQLSEALLLNHSLQCESTTVDSAVIGRVSLCVFSRNNAKQQQQQPAASSASLILKPSAPPFEEEAVAAVSPPVSSCTSAAAVEVSAAESPSYHVASQKASQALDLDQPSDDMMDQCPPSPHLLLSRSRCMYIAVVRPFMFCFECKIV
jgi:hypothetical protein